MISLARELIDKILSYTPLLSSGNAHTALETEMYENEAAAYTTWKSIFKSEEWLNKIIDETKAMPFLVGANLNEIALPPMQRKKRSIFALLHTADRSGDARYMTSGRYAKEKDENMLFFRCLRDGYEYDKRRGKIIFPDIQLVLDMQEPLYNYEVVPLGKDLRRLVHCHNNELYCWYSFFAEKKVKQVKSPEIIGIGGPIYTRKAVEPVFALNLQYLGESWQFIFEGQRHGWSFSATNGKPYAAFRPRITAFQLES